MKQITAKGLRKEDEFLTLDIEETDVDGEANVYDIPVVYIIRNYDDTVDFEPVSDRDYRSIGEVKNVPDKWKRAIMREIHETIMLEFGAYTTFIDVY